MDLRQAVVKDGRLIDVVLVEDDIIHNYILPEGAQLVSDLSFEGKVKPFRSGETWVETATPEEIAERYPEPTPPQPSMEDYLLDLDYRVSMLELGI